MYVYQHMDGWYRLALYTSQRERISVLVAHPMALSAYRDAYSSQAGAEGARSWISAHVGEAF